MPNLPHVTWLRAFEAAARHNSFSSAADELGLTPAAISQQIRLLEKHLNAQLFIRLARGVQLTDVGQAYAQPIRKSFGDMAQATEGLFAGQQKRILRVRASISCAALVLAPRLSEFQRAHPDIAVHLSTSVWADRFDEETLDVDIRYGQGDWAERQIFHLGHEFAVPVCHPDYARALGPNLSIQRLAAADVIQIVGSETDWSRLSDLHDLNLTPRMDWLRADSSLIALQTTMTGHGVTMVLESFARQYLDQGQLIAPLPYKLPKQRSHYVVVNDHTTQIDAAHTFCNWLSALYQDLDISP